jgi:hypothetical protein
MLFSERRINMKRFSLLTDTQLFLLELAFFIIGLVMTIIAVAIRNTAPWVAIIDGFLGGALVGHSLIMLFLMVTGRVGGRDG